MAHLRYVEKKKREEREQKKSATTKSRQKNLKDQSERDHKTDTVMVSDTMMVSDTTTVSDTVMVSVPTPLSEKPKTTSDLLSMVQSDILRFTPRMTEYEIRIYLYLIGQTHAADPPKDRTEYNQRAVMTALGVTSPPTMTRTLKSLRKKNLVTWLRRSRGRGDNSILRVWLPWKRDPN